MKHASRPRALIAPLLAARAVLGSRWLLLCLALCGMTAAQAQVTATSIDVQHPYNAWRDIYLSATDATPGAPQTFSYAIASWPAHGSLGVLWQNSVVYTPEAGYIGEDSFTYTATTANGSSALATVHITVLGPVPPVANDSSFTVRFNTPADLLLGGQNPNAGSDQRVYFESVTPPAHGSTVFNDYNWVIYTPQADYTGPDSFTFRVWHPVWGYSNVATVHLTVAAAAPPVAQPGIRYVPHGTPTPIALSAQDPNPGGPYALAYAVSTPPAHGSITIDDSTATYTPAPGAWGWDSFGFTATSVNGTSAPATVRVLVGQPVTLGVAGTLGDTGQTQCTDSAGLAIACATPASHPGQDGRFGRDAQAGAPAFDFAALSGGCVQDRVTGLTWSTETLIATRPAAATAAASTSRCGIDTGWRLPTRRELLGIVHHGAASPAIDGSAFPATHSAPYWSSDTAGANAWAVQFADGGTRLLPQAETHAARLVARPVNEAPTITLGEPEIVLSNNEMPGPRSYPGWATGISPGPAREAGQQLIATVRLLPVPGIKTLEFSEAPTIDPATGDLRFTVLHRIYPEGQLFGQDVFYWTSSAGRVRVEVTLQDDGGTAGGGVDTTVKTFDIEVSPVPLAFRVPIKHPWKAACIPVTLHAQDIDTDPKTSVVYPLRYEPLFQIKEYPRHGFLTDYVVSSRALQTKSISVPLGDTVDSVSHVGITGNRAPVPGPVSPWGFYAATVCYVPFSSTFIGSDSFTYTAIDVDGNESAPASVDIDIFEVD